MKMKEKGGKQKKRKRVNMSMWKEKKKKKTKRSRARERARARARSGLDLVSSQGNLLVFLGTVSLTCLWVSVRWKDGEREKREKN